MDPNTLMIVATCVTAGALVALLCLYAIDLAIRSKGL